MLRQGNDQHDWLLDEPWFWFAMWLLCIAAWLVLMALLPHSLPNLIIETSPILLSGIFSPWWMLGVHNWWIDRRWRKTLKAITEESNKGHGVRLRPYAGEYPTDYGNFPWSVGSAGEPVTAEDVKAAVQRLRDQHDISPLYGWNGGAQDAPREGETPSGPR